MARVEFTQDIAGDQPATPAHKAARGARWYRSCFERALQILDTVIILLVTAYVLKVTTGEPVLTATLSACLPMALSGVGLWWMLREHDLYRFDVEASAVTHGVKTLGAVVLALPVLAAIRALEADYAHRHRIKPSMTGWAAIHGSRGPVHHAEDVAARVAFDITHSRAASLWPDLGIMVRTLPALLGNKGSVR